MRRRRLGDTPRSGVAAGWVHAAADTATSGSLDARLMGHAVTWFQQDTGATSVLFSPVDARGNLFAAPPIVHAQRPGARPLDVVAFCRAYVAGAADLDPFAPRRFRDSHVSVAGSRELGGPDALEASGYPAHLRSFGLASQAAVYLRSAGRIVGAVLLLRTPGQGDFSRDEIAALRRTHGLIEEAYRLARPQEDRAAPGALRTLTPRQREVARLAAAGATNAEIAAALDVSTPTIKAHMTNVMAKLGVSSRAELILQLGPWSIDSHDAPD